MIKRGKSGKSSKTLKHKLSSLCGLLIVSVFVVVAIMSLSENKVYAETQLITGDEGSTGSDGSSASDGYAWTSNGLGWNSFSVNGSNPITPSSTASMPWAKAQADCKAAGFSKIWISFILGPNKGADTKRYLYNFSKYFENFKDDNFYFYHWYGVDSNPDMLAGKTALESHNKAQAEYERFDGKGNVDQHSWFCGGDLTPKSCPDKDTTYSDTDKRTIPENWRGQKFEDINKKPPYPNIQSVSDCYRPKETNTITFKTLYACYHNNVSKVTSKETPQLIDSSGSPTADGKNLCEGNPVTSTSHGIPTTQFLGGGVLTKSDINTTAFTTNSSKDRIFGTWTEYAIVSGGKVNGMGSGSAFGYNGGFDSATTANSASKNGGGNKRGGGLVTAGLSNTANNYKCAYSKMTIVNSDCDNSTKSVGSASDVGNKISKSTAQRLKLEEWFKPDDSINSNAYGNHLSTRTAYAKNGNDTSGKPIKCSETTVTIQKPKDKNGNELPNMTLYANDFRVICGNKVIINTDIIISDTDTYTADTVPQVLIFAKDVDIRSGVSVLDAWIIATGKVDTCVVPSGGVGCDKNQLVINGPVYTETLKLSRTYTNLDSKSFEGDKKGCEESTKTNIATSSTIKGKEGTEKWGFAVYYRLYDWTGATTNNTSPKVTANGTDTKNYSDGTTATPGVASVDVCFVAEPAEVFNLRQDAKIWAYSETKKRQSNASVTGLTEVLPFW